jgi:hypothetical protein
MKPRLPILARNFNDDSISVKHSLAFKKLALLHEGILYVAYQFIRRNFADAWDFIGSPSAAMSQAQRSSPSTIPKSLRPAEYSPAVGERKTASVASSARPEPISPK